MSDNGKNITPFSIILAVSVLLSILLGYLWLDNWIDNKIDDKITDPSYIRKVASQVRPSVVFDSKNSILIDLGGMQYIDSIQVEDPGKYKSGHEFKITVSPKIYLDHAPVLTSFDFNNYLINENRGEKFNWVYTLQLMGSWVVIDEQGKATSPSIRKFRLEIIPPLK